MATAVYSKQRGITYYLHKKLAGRGKSHYIYFFSKDPDGAIDIPPYLEVVMNSKGFPLVRRKGK